MTVKKGFSLCLSPDYCSEESLKEFVFQISETKNEKETLFGIFGLLSFSLFLWCPWCNSKRLIYCRIRFLNFEKLLKIKTCGIDVLENTYLMFPLMINIRFC